MGGGLRDWGIEEGRNMALEIEVKFYLEAAEAIRERIRALGARSLGRHFETNIRFEDAGKSLLAKKALLRLRKTHKTTLTFKAEPAEADGDFKVFQELEVEVGDFDTAVKILEALGFRPEQVYEKWRETFRLLGTTLSIDRLPYGDFLEIEGERDAIMDVAHRLELDWRDRILSNYLAIFDHLRRDRNLPFNDVTFENFQHFPLVFDPYRSFFTAG